MGVGASSAWLTADEVSQLTAFSSATAWAFDAEEWMALLHTKWPLDTHPTAVLLQNFKDIGDRLVRNDSTSHNLATLCAHIASRLPRSFYFTDTDLDMTRNALVLARLSLLHLYSVANASDDNAEAQENLLKVIKEHLEVAPNAARTANPHVTGYSFHGFVRACLDFLSSAVKDDTYDLHVQVYDLLLCLLAPQMLSKDLLAAASLLAAGNGGVSKLAGHDYVIAEVLVAGREVITLPSSTPPTPSQQTQTTAVRGDAVIGALLNAIMLDCGRDGDSGIEPTEGAAATLASEACATARTQAFKKAAGTQTDAKGEASGSLLSSIASAATGLISMPAGEELVARPLAERACLLMCLLVHNCRSGVHVSVSAAANPYRDALSRLADSESALRLYADTTGNKGGILPHRPILLPFKTLFAALSKLCGTPLGIALLYTLLHVCTGFTDFTLTRSNIEDLLLPCLLQLYHIYALSPEHRYILLVTLLLFSQDATFCETAHRRIKLEHSKHLSFFEERLLGEIPLGSLLFILLARVITSGGAQPVVADASAYGSEDYLQVNCLAVTCNMAPYVENIHPYAAQKLVTLLGSLFRRYKRAAAKVAEMDAAGTHKQGAATTDAAGADSVYAKQRSLLSRTSQLIRMLVEALHAMCAPSQLHTNVALLYVMLRERTQVIDAIAADPAFSEVAVGLVEILNHFVGVLRGEEIRRQGGITPSASPPPASPEVNAAVAPAMSPPASPLVSDATVVWEETEVSEILVAAARTFRGGSSALAAANNLKDAKYSYEEDQHPEVFFVPYVWSMVLEFTVDCGWSILQTTNLRLFTNKPFSLYVGLHTADVLKKKDQAK